MIRRLRTGALRAFAAAVVAVAGSARVPAAEVGDPAAPLNVAEWIKGEAVNLADARGRQIVVVEFWATWCGPCRASIPHLTELQNKFADRGVVFVGVSSEDAAKVRPFVEQMGARMNYRVAVDRNGQTSDGYLKAYGRNGIPCAFIVDREGRIAWVGHPMAELEEKLETLAAAPAAEAPAEKRRAEALRRLHEFGELAAQGGDRARLDALAAELTALDNELGGIEPGRKLDVAELRRTMRFQSLMRDYQRAVSAGRSAAELAALEQQATPFAPKGFRFEDYRGQFSLQRTFQDYYRAVTGKGDAAKAAELAARLERIKSADSDALNEMAWALLTDERITARNLPLALALAQAAVEASGGKNPGVLDTYARALFDNGKAAEAVIQVKRALELTTDADQKAELTEALQRYEAKAR